MPAKSASQKRLMDAAANNPAFAKKVGIPAKVAKEYSESSKGMSFKKGNEMKTKKMNIGGGVEAKGKTKGKMVKMADGGMSTTVMPPARSMPPQSNAGGAMRGLDRAAAMSGRTMPATGRPLGMKKGGSIDGCAVRGKTKATMVKMAQGGKC